MPIEGFILVGGASSRMGTDKSRLVFGEQNAVERITAGLSSMTTRVSLVGTPADNRTSSLQSIPDVHPRWGPLGGIHAALVACQAEWAAVIACDLPFVTSELLERLWSLCKSFDAVVPIQSDERPQPLCALYRRAPCMARTEELIVKGEHTLRALLAMVATRWVQNEELSDLPGAEHFFLNVNTPADYERALAIIGSSRREAAN